MTSNLIEAMARAMCSCMCKAYVADCSDCDSWANECDYAHAALTAIEAAGYRVVPAEITDAMQAAFFLPPRSASMRERYKDMLAAAPR